MQLFEAVLAELMQTASDGDGPLKNTKADAALEDVAKLPYRNQLVTDLVVRGSCPWRRYLLIIGEARNGECNEFISRVAHEAEYILGFFSRTLHFLNPFSSVNCYLNVLIVEYHHLFFDQFLLLFFLLKLRLSG